MLTGHDFPDSASLMIVGVDSFHLGIPSGLLYNCYVKTGIPFYGLMDLFRSANYILDMLNHPQLQFEPRRIFNEKLKGRALPDYRPSPPDAPLEPFWKLDELEAATVAVDLFVVRVIFRQNASLQGWVEWPRGHCRANYRSALELGEMILEALELTNRSGWANRNLWKAAERRQRRALREHGGILGEQVGETLHRKAD